MTGNNKVPKITNIIKINFIFLFLMFLQLASCNSNNEEDYSKNKKIDICKYLENEDKYIGKNISLFGIAHLQAKGNSFIVSGDRCAKKCIYTEASEDAYKEINKYRGNLNYENSIFVEAEIEFEGYMSITICNYFTPFKISKINKISRLKTKDDSHILCGKCMLGDGKCGSNPQLLTESEKQIKKKKNEARSFTCKTLDKVLLKMDRRDVIE